jgi:hypothetical protein
MQLDPSHHHPGGLVISILKIFLQFVLTAGDPHTTCELAHRDAYITGTYYLYCAQPTTDGTEVISVGHFVPDGWLEKKP